MAKVLVPLDGSAAAERAVVVGQALALQLFADLVLVRSSFDTPEREVVAYLDGVLDRFDLDLDATGKVVCEFPPDAIHDLAVGDDDGILCLASHGRSALGHYLFGSLSEAIVAQAAVPAFVVGPHVDLGVLDRLGAIPQPRAGWCIDAATDVETIGPVCADWAERLRLDVDILTVRAEDDRPVSRFHPATGRQLDRAVALLEERRVRARRSVLKEAQPARRLARYATDHSLALLIAAKRSCEGPARDVLGSTTMNLVHQSPCPVLLPVLPCP
jgi:nucleotide-binding universal stress UspA family protein